MTAQAHPRVLLVGGGIAALELLLALRVQAQHRLAITLLSAEPEFAPPAMSVAEPFERGAAPTHGWRQIASDQNADFVLDRLVAVDTDARIAFTHGGRRLRYDVLALATGARRVQPLVGSLTFGIGGDGAARLRAAVADMPARGASIAFALPWPSVWSLPLYELALLTANELRERGSAARVRIVTPEARALEQLGPAASDAVLPLLDALGVELVTDAQPREVMAGGLRLDGGEIIEADHVVALADIVARPVPGLPVDRMGFVPVDPYGRVVGEPSVYAAGEATSFPLRQGGLAAQQADAAAETIAATCAGGEQPQAFMPVLRGRLMTSGAPVYLQARPSGQSLASHRAMWSPPEKVAGRYIAPYLATARPPNLAAAALVERVPAAAGTGRDERSAVMLALAIATVEARCHNGARALQALDAAQALDPGLQDHAYVTLRARLSEKVAAA